jgi:hypothetical protein
MMTLYLYLVDGTGVLRANIGLHSLNSSLIIMENSFHDIDASTNNWNSRGIFILLYKN